jgi:PTH1 family peptidyl-tRNA hydrolase
VAETDRPQVILICLGNPGERFAGTRHNAGMLFGEWLSERHGLPKPTAVEGTPALEVGATLNGMAVLLVWPLVSMNDSGAVLTALLERYGDEDVMWAVAYDDLDLALGKAKGRQKGGHGGHNGVRSILDAAGGTPVFRIKLGVASAARSQHGSPVEFLLEDFTSDELSALEEAFPQAEGIFIGQLKSLAATLATRNRHADLTSRFESEILEDARDLVADLPDISPRPVFLRRGQVRRALDVAAALAKLLRKARGAAADDAAVLARLRSFVPAPLLELMPAPDPSTRLFFAVDFHASPDGLKVVELNCAVGYAHYAQLADEALFPFLSGRVRDLKRPSEAGFAEFLYREGLRPLHDAGRGCIAFLRGFSDRDMFNVDELERLARAVERVGHVPIPLCHESDLMLGDDGLRLADGRRIDLLYVEENLSEWSDVAPGSPLLEAVRSGSVKTFPSLDAFLFTNKGFLTVLVDRTARGWLMPDGEESKILRENVLWSAPLDERIESAAYYMLEQGLPLVVKGALGGGGRGVTILRPDAASQRAGQVLREGLENGSAVVQAWFPPGAWGERSDLRFDVRVLVAAHESDIVLGPVYGRVFRGEKANFADADSGAAPVYVID